MNEILTDDNFLLYAVRSYKTAHFLEQEFFSDLKRLKYVKRLIQRYRKGGNLKLRLLLNHIILLYNVFDTEFCTKMLFLKIDEKDHLILKTILSFLGYMPTAVKNVAGKDYLSKDIEIDKHIKNLLEEL